MIRKYKVNVSQKLLARGAEPSSVEFFFKGFDISSIHDCIINHVNDLPYGVSNFPLSCLQD